MNADRSASSAGKKNPGSGPERRRAWSELGTAFWIALLLGAIAYATWRGESAFGDLEQLRLIVDF